MCDPLLGKVPYLTGYPGSGGLWGSRWALAGKRPRLTVSVNIMS